MTNIDHEIDDIDKEIADLEKKKKSLKAEQDSLGQKVVPRLASANDEFLRIIASKREVPLAGTGSSAASSQPAQSHPNQSAAAAGTTNMTF